MIIVKPDESVSTTGIYALSDKALSHTKLIVISSLTAFPFQNRFPGLRHSFDVMDTAPNQGPLCNISHIAPQASAQKPALDRLKTGYGHLSDVTKMSAVAGTLFQQIAPPHAKVG